jgi:hypothetical protein
MCLSLCLSRSLSVCLSPPSLPLLPPLGSLAFAYEKQEDRDRGRGGVGFEHRCRRGGRRNRLEEGASEIDRERESLRVVCIDCVCM